jgi:hypothetical protein
MTLGLDPAIFDKFQPLNTLTEKGRQALAKGITVVTVPRDGYLFRAGDSSLETMYVLEGTVTLLTADNRVRGSIHGGSPECLHPMPLQVPCTLSAVADTEVRVLKVDTKLLNSVMSWDQAPPTAAMSPSATGRRDGRGG